MFYSGMKSRSYSISRCILLFFGLLFFWTGCAKVPVPTRSPHAGQPGEAGRCADLFAALDKRIEAAGVVDPGVFRVEDFPYLRVNRFLASFRGEVDGQAAFSLWVDRLQELDQQARQFEIANLPDSEIVALEGFRGRRGLSAEIAACADILQAEDFSNEKNRNQVRENAAAPEDYIPLRRFLGLYPLTSLIVSQRVSAWHAEVHKTFSPGPPVGWQTIRYFPAESFNMPYDAQIVQAAGRDALGIPVYTSEELETLFRKWAPVWEIQDQGDYDKLGEPIWTGKGVLKIDTNRPVTYTLPSFTRFGDKILTQLNYIIWFPARPKESVLDIYGGFLDGLIYRVTLDTNGEAILYETVHNCGCYYKAYPTERLQVQEKIVYAEPPLILQAPALNPAKAFMTVAMESRTHYVQHLYPSTREIQGEKTVYSFADYNLLRSLPYHGDKRKSMFGRDSIVPGSQRLERFILWPTGILSPGAMRQWGRHAVAFVGERHFDDPFFMDKMFKETESR